MKKFFKRLYLILSVVTAIGALVVLITGKQTFSEQWAYVKASFHITSTNTKKIESTEIKDAIAIFPTSDNFVTTFFKTFFVIVAIVFILIAAFVSAILEAIIWILSFGDNSFICTKLIWNLLWNDIVSKWYWNPANSTYLWIILFLYSGFTGVKSNETAKKS